MTVSARRRDPRVARSPLPGGQEPARVHREPASGQAWPGAGTMENDMKRLRVGVVGVGHLGQHHARILAAMPGVELVAVADARAEQAQAVAAKCGTVGPGRLPAAPRAGRCRHDRRTHVLAPRSRRGLPGQGHRHPGREADGRLAGRVRAARRAGQSIAARSCRSATSSDSTRPCRRSRAWRFVPSTSTPSGSRPTPFARPTSASSST